MEQFITGLLLAIPVACVAWTVTQEEIFREFREWCNKHSKDTKRTLVLCKLAYLPTCYYCFSHWVSFVAVFITGYTLLFDGWRGYIIGAFTLVAIANIYLTGFNILRVVLRGMRAWADRLERLAKDTAS